MTNSIPIRDIEAQYPAAGDSIAPVIPALIIPPDSSPRLLEPYDGHRDSSATTILPPAGIPESRRPSMIKETSPAEHDEVPRTSSTHHPWWHPITRPVVQMIVAAALAVVIGIAVAATVDQVPDAARALLVIPGELWLRALKCIGEYSLNMYHVLHSNRRRNSC